MREKQMTTLNERDALSDLLSTEKKIMSLYSYAIGEGSGKEYRTKLFEGMEEVSANAFEVFDEMQTRGYYPVEEAEEEEIRKKIEEMTKFQPKFEEKQTN
ncbi:MAG: spore coat protein [Clostridia bacterium]|nr:spore coat protein [Clostridia bacterium]